MMAKNLKHKKHQSDTSNNDEYQVFMEQVEAQMESAQLSIAEKKAEFKRIKENGARLTKHRFTI